MPDRSLGRSRSPAKAVSLTASLESRGRLCRRRRFCLCHFRVALHPFWPPPPPAHGQRGERLAQGSALVVGGSASSRSNGSNGSRSSGGSSSSPDHNASKSELFGLDDGDDMEFVDAIPGASDPEICDEAGQSRRWADVSILEPAPRQAQQQGDHGPGAAHDQAARAVSPGVAARDRLPLRLPQPSVGHNRLQATKELYARVSAMGGGQTSYERQHSEKLDGITASPSKMTTWQEGKETRRRRISRGRPPKPLGASDSGRRAACLRNSPSFSGASPGDSVRRHAPLRRPRHSASTPRPPRMGLWQVAALQCLQVGIRRQCGDPERTGVLGEAAGVGGEGLTPPNQERWLHHSLRKGGETGH